MKKMFPDQLRCLDCSKSDWNLHAELEIAQEIRSGVLQCNSCGRNYPIENGILNALGTLPEEVAREKEHAESFDYLTLENGEKYPISRDTFRKFPQLFLSLPAGDGSACFKPGGSFDNQAGNAPRFFKTLEALKLTGKERVLEVGASFCWGSRQFALRGCDVTAVDITHYLNTSDLYFEHDGIYFERVMSDMSILPFKNETFDIIFSHSVIHHCKELKALFQEFRRVLRPGGRVVALHECAFGIWEDKAGSALQQAIEDGFNENAYTLLEWKNAAKEGGFAKPELHFFSLIDDYIERKERRNASDSFKLKVARFIRSYPALNHGLNRLSYWPRIFLRPKAWMLIASRE